MESGVYLIRNRKDSKVYVGSAARTRRRLNTHRNQLARGKHPNQYLQRSYDKHGAENFEFIVIERCLRDDLLVVEQRWIDHHDSTNEEFGYNLLPTRSSPMYSEAIAPLRQEVWDRFDEDERRERCKHLTENRDAEYQRRVAEGKRNSEKFTRVRKEVAMRTVASPATRKKNSERLKRLWQDPEWRAARLAGLDRGREKTNAKRKAKAQQRRDSLAYGE